MPSSTDNVKLGVCSVIYGGKNLGFTKGGVEVEVATSTHEVTVDQYGETPVGELITGRTVSATVPLAETTLENLVQIMPGATLETDGAKSTGTVTFDTTPPVSGDSVTVSGTKFTFRTAPKTEYEMPIPATIEDAAIALAEKIDATEIPYDATFAAGVVTITAKSEGVAYDGTITSVGANITVVDLTGGADPTAAYVDVKTGVNINLLDVAKELVLRPRGTNGEDDFVVYRAACPGALNFSYSTDQERIYSAAFKGYVTEAGSLFAVGDVPGNI